MAGEFTIPSSVKPARTGQLANPDEYNQNIAAQSQGRLLAIDEDGAYEDNFDIGDQTVGSTGSLVQYIRLREGGALKIYDSSGVFVQDVNLGQATESVIGQAEIATQSETNAGTDDTKFLTALKLKNSVYNSRELISEVNASGASSIFFQSLLTSDYKNYEVEITNMDVSVDSYLQCQLGSGASYNTSGYTGASVQGTPGVGPTGRASGTGAIDLTSNAGGWFIESSSGKTFSGVVRIYNPSGTSYHKQVTCIGVYWDSSNEATYRFSGGFYSGDTAAKNSIKFYLNTGSIAGNFKLYGLK